jgi:hypothetical protein
MKVFIIFLFIYTTLDATRCSQTTPRDRAWQLGASTIATMGGVIMGALMTHFKICAGQENGCAVAVLPVIPGAFCLALVSVCLFRDHLRPRGNG